MFDVSTAPLVTRRLVLRPASAAHASALWEALRDPAIYAFIPREPPTSLADVEARLTRIAQRTAPGRADQWLNWSIWLGDAAIGLVESTVTPAGLVEIAYLLDPRYWRRGYAREAISAVLDALSAAGAVGFSATIDSRNAASRALIAALGFSLAEERKRADYFKGAWSDEEVWRRSQSG